MAESSPSNTLRKPFSVDRELSEAYREYAAKKMYENPAAVSEDIMAVHFTGKRFQVVRRPSNDDPTRICIRVELPYLRNGISVIVPVCVYLDLSHPRRPPKCYCSRVDGQSISDMCTTIAIDGRITLQYLDNWSAASNIGTLLQHIDDSFAGDFPLVPRKPTPMHQITMDCYRYEELVREGIDTVRNACSDLQVSYGFGDQIEPDVMKVYVYGTLQAGDLFATRVPICVWLDRQYPHSRPHCYVEQSSTADIGNGKHVDAGGLVHLQYLAEWKYPQCDLTGLIKAMEKVFHAECPVFVRRKEYVLPEEASVGCIDLNSLTPSFAASQAPRPVETRRTSHQGSDDSDSLPVGGTRGAQRRVVVKKITGAFRSVFTKPKSESGTSVEYWTHDSHSPDSSDSTDDRKICTAQWILSCARYRRTRLWLVQNMEMAEVRVLCDGYHLISRAQITELEALEARGRLVHNEKLMKLIELGETDSLRSFANDVLGNMGVGFDRRKEDLEDVLDAFTETRSL